MTHWLITVFVTTISIYRASIYRAFDLLDQFLFPEIDAFLCKLINVNEDIYHALRFNV